MARYRQACRLVESIEAVVGREKKEDLLAGLGTPTPGWSAQRKADWFRELIRRMDEALPEEQRRAIRERCSCPVSPRSVAVHRRALLESADLATYTRAVRDHGWVAFEAEDETLLVTTARERCWCRMPLPDGEPMSQTYCYCAAGHLRTLFEAVFRRPVQVQIVRTLLSGGQDCTFRVAVGPGPYGSGTTGRQSVGAPDRRNAHG